VINEQTFESYAIISNGSVDVVRTSRRQLLKKEHSDSNASPLMQAFAIIGTLISVTGFIFQFIGLRGMHW